MISGSNVTCNFHDRCVMELPVTLPGNRNSWRRNAAGIFPPGEHGIAGTPLSRVSRQRQNGSGGVDVKNDHLLDPLSRHIGARIPTGESAGLIGGKWHVDGVSRNRVGRRGSARPESRLERTDGHCEGSDVGFGPSPSTRWASSCTSQKARRPWSRQGASLELSLMLGCHQDQR